jgi:hypothetical protein
VQITVAPVNDTPVADDQSVTTAEDQPLPIRLTGRDVDGDALEFIPSSPSHGSVVSAPDGQFLYTPDGDYYGPDAFTFTAIDPSGAPATATVSIEVTPRNDLPTADPQDVSTDEDVPLTITLGGTDAEGSPLTATVGQPEHGTLTRSAGNVYSYTPAANFHGQDAFTFTMTDGDLVSGPATVEITIRPVNDDPTLADIAPQTVTEGHALTFQAQATDIDGDTPSFEALGLPADATFNTTTGAFAWTPGEAKGPGVYEVTVRASDGTAVDGQVVTITVHEENTAPVLAFIGSRRASPGTAVTFTAAASDADLPPNGLRFTLDAGAPSEARIDAASGAFSWTPTEADLGTHSITIRVTDDGGPALDDFETFTVDVAQLPQTITFDLSTQPAKTYGDEPFTVAATASSGLLVSFAAQGSCTVSEATVTITGSGSCSLTAAQAGSAAYLAAAPVTQEFGIAKAALLVQADDKARQYGEANPEFTGTITGIKYTDRLSATYATPATSTTPAGSYPIIPTLVDPDGRAVNYDVTLVNGTLTIVGKQSQTISFTQPATKVFTDPAFSVTDLATSSSGLSIAFSTPTADRCSTTSDGGTVKLLDVGVDAAGCAITASQGGDDLYEAAADVTRTFDIYNKLDAVTGSTTAQRNNEVQFGGSVIEFNVSILTIRNADGSVLFDAARLEAGSVTVTGPSGKVAQPVRNKDGTIKTTLIDTNGDATRDRVLYFLEADVFDSQHVGGNWTITLNGRLLTVSGDPKRDGRPVRGTDIIRLR